MKTVLCAVVLSLPVTLPAADLTQIEKRRLFEPTASERMEESAGRIYIYDGLTDQVVRQAMQREFDRIENMMFIRVKQTDADGRVRKDPKTGQAEVEDDGC